jgi:hypothetical protein
MRALTFAFACSALCVAVCSAEQPEVSGQANANQTACELAKSAPTSSGNHVEVRARLRLYAHSAVIIDDNCPDVRILLEQADGGPNMSFCDLDFECPLNTENFVVIATFIGTYGRLGPNSGRLRLEKIQDLKRTRVVARAAPNTSLERTREG